MGWKKLVRNCCDFSKNLFNFYVCFCVNFYDIYGLNGKKFLNEKFNGDIHDISQLRSLCTLYVLLVYRVISLNAQRFGRHAYFHFVSDLPHENAFLESFRMKLYSMKMFL